MSSNLTLVHGFSIVLLVEISSIEFESVRGGIWGKMEKMGESERLRKRISVEYNENKRRVKKNGEVC